MDAVDFQMIQQVELEQCEIGVVIHIVANVGVAEARMLWGDDLEMLGQFFKPRLVVPEALGAMRRTFSNGFGLCRVVHQHRTS